MSIARAIKVGFANIIMLALENKKQDQYFEVSETD